jgi:hypothetical protein
MRTETRTDADVVQPRLIDRVATLLGRYRLVRQRSRTVRRVVAVALLVAAAALATVPPPAGAGGIATLVTARDLPAGASLTAADVATRLLAEPPDGALTALPKGDSAPMVLSGPMRRGEALTDARILTDRGPDPGPGRAAIPVPLADAALIDLLRPGMRVVLVRLPHERVPLRADDSVGASPVSADAVVLSVPDPPTGGFGATTRFAVVAVRSDVADAVTAAAALGTLTVRFGA